MNKKISFLLIILGIVMSFATGGIFECLEFIISTSILSLCCMYPVFKKINNNLIPLK